MFSAILMTELQERKTLLNIESRLSNVESTLQDILENGELMEERIKDKLTDIKDEMEKNTLQVKKIKAQLNNSRYKPFTILVVLIVILILWTLIVHWFRL